MYKYLKLIIIIILIITANGILYSMLEIQELTIKSYYIDDMFYVEYGKIAVFVVKKKYY